LRNGPAGEMGEDMERQTIFRAIFFVLLAALIVIRMYYGWKMRRAGESGWSLEEEAVEREGRWSILLRVVLALFSLAAIILYAINPAWLGTFALPLPPWSQWIGVGLGAAGLILLAWVHHALGRGWSTNLQVRTKHTLVTSGPYRWARHPMYTALFGFFAGLVLVSASWLVALLVVVAIFVLYARVGKEEAMMIEQFGDEYRHYMQRTGRFLPRLKA
jgi:protein-S-isoprenylcysteine O-methyltransferase Ste14